MTNRNFLFFNVKTILYLLLHYSFISVSDSDSSEARTDVKESSGVPEFFLEEKDFTYPTSCLKKGKEYIPLHFISLNARDISNKYPHLHNLIFEENPDVIAVTETFLDDQIQDSEFQPEGYKVFRKDRNIKYYHDGTYVDSNRGGVLLLIKDYLNPTLNPASNVEAELLWVNIAINPKSEWIVGVCYRPEKDEDFMLAKIKESINSIDNQNVLLMGDFNFRNIDWINGNCARPIEQDFLDTINDNLLHQIVDIPTRGSNILDLAFIGDPSAVYDFSIIDPLGNSDHKMVSIKLQCIIPRVNQADRKIYLYSQGDYEAMNAKIGTYDWDSILKSKDTNENWLVFQELYHDLIEEFVPSKLVRPGQRLSFPWVRYRSVKRAKKHYHNAKTSARVSGLNAEKYVAEDLKKGWTQQFYQPKVTMKIS